MKDSSQSYFARTASWADAQSESVRASRRVAWFVAAGFAVIAVCEAAGLASLVPLKSTRAVPILVDSQTGFVQVLQDDGKSKITANKALTRAFLAQYVMAREEFDITTVANNFHKVMLWSGGEARTAYASVMPVQNPNSPLNLYPHDALVQVAVQSINDLSPNTALVRFTLRRHDGDGAAGVERHYAAVLSYTFSDFVLSAGDRLQNPLGFQVVRYSKDEETAAPAVAPTSDLKSGAPPLSSSTLQPASMTRTPEAARPIVPEPRH